MNQTDLLQKLASLGVAAFSAIPVIGIVTVPAQAATVGVLEWDEGTDDFFDDALDDIGVGLFDVTFINPDLEEDLGQVTFVSGASGIFDPIFSPLGETNLLGIPTGTFTATGTSTPLPGLGTEYEYLLDNDLVWNFDPNENGIADAIYTMKAGSIFEVFVDDDETEVSVQLVQLEAGSWVVGEVDPETFDATQAEFDFGQIEDADFGGYEQEANATTGVPEPATILGLLTVSGLALALKRNKQL